jgi:hypothetical protein
VDEIRVHSWMDLQEAVFTSSWQHSISRFRSDFVFRGASLAGHGLVTSLQAGGYEPHELHLLTSFRKYALRNAVHGDSLWNWLSLAKHHGLPTRLLDWTYSPYVAMHFATHSLAAFGEDGAIWCVDYKKANELLPRRFRKLLEDASLNIFTTEMLSELAATLRDFDAMAKHDFVAFFEPPSLDERIVNQFALFSLPSRSNLRLDEFFDRQPNLCRRIIIPAELKWEIRDKLDQGNITERVLFPGLDGLSAWLKRYFTTREPAGAGPHDEKTRQAVNGG